MKHLWLQGASCGTSRSWIASISGRRENFALLATSAAESLTTMSWAGEGHGESRLSDGSHAIFNDNRMVSEE